MGGQSLPMTDSGKGGSERQIGEAHLPTNYPVPLRSNWRNGFGLVSLPLLFGLQNDGVRPTGGIVPALRLECRPQWVGRAGWRHRHCRWLHQVTERRSGIMNFPFSWGLGLDARSTSLEAAGGDQRLDLQPISAVSLQMALAIHGWGRHPVSVAPLPSPDTGDQISIKSWPFRCLFTREKREIKS